MGSLHYIAPEILDGSGHSFQVDLFSLGIYSPDYSYILKVFFFMSSFVELYLLMKMRKILLKYIRPL